MAIKPIPYVLSLKCYMKDCGKEWTGIFPEGFDQNNNYAECPKCHEEPFTGEIVSVELKGIVSIIYKFLWDIGNKQWSEFKLKMDSIKLYNAISKFN